MSTAPWLACWMPSTMMKQAGAALRIAAAMAPTSTAMPVTGEVWTMVATRTSGVMMGNQASTPTQPVLSSCGTSTCGRPVTSLQRAMALREAGCSSVVDSMMPPGAAPRAAVLTRRNSTSVPLSPTKTWPDGALKNSRMSALALSIAAIRAFDAGLSRPWLSGMAA